MKLATSRTARGLLAACGIVLFALAGSVPATGGPGEPAELSFTGCEVGPGLAIIRFAVVNHSLPDICDLHIQPASPACPVSDARAPSGWSYVVNADGSVDWFANTPADCIPAGSARTGFSVRVDSGSLCCFDFQLTDATGAVIYSGVKCFSCDPVSVEPNTWGRVKVLYR